MRLDHAGALDLDVKLEANGKSATARVVAELAPDGEFHWYLTSVSREVLSIDDVSVLDASENRGLAMRPKPIAYGGAT